MKKFVYSDKYRKLSVVLGYKEMVFILYKLYSTITRMRHHILCVKL